MTDIIETIKKDIAKNRSLIKDLDVQGKEVDSDKLSSLKKGVKEVSDSFGSIKFREDVVGYYTNSIRRDLTQIDDGNDITSDVEGTLKELKEKIDMYLDIKKEVSSLSEDYQQLLKGIGFEFESKNASITDLVDKVATSLEGKGCIAEALMLDKIANAIEAGLGNLGTLKRDFRKTGIPSDFRELIKSIKVNFSSRPKARAIIEELRGKSPNEAIVTLFTKIGGEISRSLFGSAKILAERYMGRYVPNNPKDVGHSNSAPKVASDEIDAVMVLLALVSGHQNMPIDSIEYSWLMNFLRSLKPNISSDVLGLKL